MNTTAMVCTAALGFLVFGLGFCISGTRKALNQFHGVPDDPTNILYKLNRAHGNTCEYAPFLAVFFVFLGSQSPTTMVEWTMIAATTCRYLFVVGVLCFPTMAKPNLARVIGALGHLYLRHYVVSGSITSDISGALIVYRC